MEVKTAIKERRSVRVFADREVEREKLMELCEAAVWAPTGGNSQPWVFIPVLKQETIKLVKTVSPGLLGNPKALIAVLSDKESNVKKMGLIGETLAEMDCCFAAQNILLLAQEYASNPMGNIRRRHLMANSDFDESVIDLLAYMLTSARGLMKEPAVYGPFRLIEGASRLCGLLAESGHGDKDFLTDLKEKIDGKKFSLMTDLPEFVGLMDEVILDVTELLMKKSNK